MTDAGSSPDRDSASVATARRELFEERLAVVRRLAADVDAAAVFVTSRRTFAWLTAGGLNHVVIGSEQGAAGLLVTPGHAVVISPNIEADRIATEEVGDLGIDVTPVPWWEPQALGAAARRLAHGEPVSDAAIEDALVGARSVLSPLEHARMAAIGQDVRAALDGALATVRDGTTEDEAVAALAARLPGYRLPVLLAAADDRIERFRHPLPTARAIRRRVMLVVVAERWGLHVASTRFRELEPPPPELRARIESTRRVEQAIHEATRPGATLGDAIAAAQAAYAREGVPDEWQLHHQGGTIAYQGRERIAVPGDQTLIEAGMAFAWNPSITGAKVEDTFILGADGERRVITG